jgi:hypothetical protein
MALWETTMVGAQTVARHRGTSLLVGAGLAVGADVLGLLNDAIRLPGGFAAGFALVLASACTLVYASVGGSRSGLLAFAIGAAQAVIWLILASPGPHRDVYGMDALLVLSFWIWIASAIVSVSVVLVMQVGRRVAARVRPGP